jgi:toxin CcdB
MAQFAVHENTSPATRKRIPFLLDIQSDLLSSLATSVVVPLAEPSVLKGRAASRLTPLFTVAGRRVVMLTPELAGVPRRALGRRIASLARHADDIVAAVDVIVSGV